MRNVLNRLGFYALWLVIFTIPWENMIFFPSLGTVARTTGIVLLPVVLLSVLAVQRVRFHRAHFFIMGFLLLAASSVFWALDQSTTIQRVFTYSQLFVLALLIFQFSRRRAYIDGFLVAYTLGSYVVSAILLYTFATLPDHGVRQTIQGFDPNDLAYTLALGIPIAWLLGLRTHHSVVRMLAYGYPFVGVLCIFLTGSRGGFVAAIVAVSIVFLSYLHLSWQVRALVLAACTVFAMTVSAVVPEQTSARIASLSDEITEGTMNARTEIWRTGLLVFADNPFAGVGAGNFSLAVAPYWGREMSSHNVYLAIATEQGIFGLLLFLCALFMVALAIRRLPLLERLACFALLATLLAVFVSGNWEARKPTWFVLSLIVTLSANAMPKGIQTQRLSNQLHPSS